MPTETAPAKFPETIYEGHDKLSGLLTYNQIVKAHEAIPADRRGDLEKYILYNTSSQFVFLQTMPGGKCGKYIAVGCVVKGFSSEAYEIIVRFAEDGETLTQVA